ncbi:MAG: hypothetical protein ACYC5N_07110 [Endomicrobiales bacterium]
MALLQSDSGMEVDVNFGEYAAGWVWYRFRFQFKGLAVINPLLFPEESFTPYEAGRDTLIPFLGDLLKNEMPKGTHLLWEPLEPHMRIDVVFKPERSLEGQVLPEKEEPVNFGGVSPSDVFELTFIFDIFTLKTSSEKLDAFYGDGIGMRMLVNREQLVAFYAELSTEYDAFLKDNQAVIDAWEKEGKYLPKNP